MKTKIKRHPILTKYLISRSGDVYSETVKSHGRKLQPYKDSHGYFQVSLFHKGKRYDKLIHHLVLETFSSFRPINSGCRHLDGNPTNNHVSNLKWGTQKENSADRDKHGRTANQKGEMNGNAILTEQEVRNIFHLYKTKQYSLSYLAHQFLVSIQCVWRIVTQKSWKHLEYEK